VIRSACLSAIERWCWPLGHERWEHCGEISDHFKSTRGCIPTTLNAAMDCSACHTVIAVDEAYLKCANERCSKHYHCQCINVSNIESDQQANWTCPECQRLTKRVGNNDSTPVNLAKRAIEANVTMRRKLPSVDPDVSEVYSISDVMLELRLLRDEVSFLTSRLQEAVNAVKSSQLKFEECENRLFRVNVPAQYPSFDSLAEGYNNNPAALHDKAELMAAATPCRPQLPHTAPNHGTKVIGPQSSKRIGKVSKKKRFPNVPKTQQDKKNAEQQTKPKMSEQKLDSTPTLTVTEESAANVVGQQLRSSTVSGTRRSLTGTAGPDVTALKAVERRKFFHLWNMASGLEDVRRYVNSICPDGACAIQELTARGDYKSYKIGVLEECYEQCFCPDLWPVNAKLKPWVNFRAARDRKFSIQNDSS
jgi:hypothetical protein